MAERVSEVLTGALVLAVAAGFVIYGSQLTGMGASGGHYAMKAAFRSVEGVTVGTDVRLAGVKIGSVTALSLDPQSFYADASFTVADGIELPDDTSARISSEGLLGGNYVELLPGGSTTNYAPGSEIEDTQGAVSLLDLLLKYVTGSGNSGSDSGASEPAN